MTLEELKEAGQAEEWLTTEGFQTLSSGYLLEGETPLDMYKRVARAAASQYDEPLCSQLEVRFLKYIRNNWLALATPVASNLGSERGLPISCYGQYMGDSISDIFKTYHEAAMLTKNGGGVGTYVGKIRARGTPIKGNGFSEGVVPWLRVHEQTFQSVGQGGVRRGAVATYLDVEHGDVEEFIDIRRPTGDISRRCLSNNFHHAVVYGDEFMNRAVEGDAHSREIWEKALRARLETGEPYMMFRDNANAKLPEGYIKNGLKVSTSQLCNEIFLYNDEQHTFVCCLSSVNLARYEEWKDDKQFIKDCIYFLDAIMEEFIVKARRIEGFEKAVRFSEKSRALGLGTLGWHTLLQSKMIPFDSYSAMELNAEIFRNLDRWTLEASKELGTLKGVPEWCVDTRNSHRLAIAPTVSNSLISGGVSQGIEPVIANYYAQKSAKGTFVRKNPALQKLLAERKCDDFDTWQQINKDGGSVMNVTCLSPEEREVFATAREINQHAIIKQAAQRQRWIDQGQSVNLFFAAPSSLNSDDKKKLGKYIHEVHLEAWRGGLKGLYYLRGESILKADNIYRSSGECKACEG
jgi:ribonucleoside-diphosphate reductase alpha chain